MLAMPSLRFGKFKSSLYLRLQVSCFSLGFYMEYYISFPKTDSDEEIESSVENLNLTPSESEDLSDYVSECDLPFCDNSPNFNNDSEIFSNPLFDSNADYTFSDDDSSSKEDVLVENFKIYSNPLLEFDEEIFSSEINPLYNEIDFLLEELAGKLALINPIPPGITETNFDLKEAIRLIKKDSASEIFNDDLAYIISPSEYEYVYADDESDSGDLTTDVVEDISGDSTGKLQISHRGFKALKINHNFFNKSPMMIYEGDMPILDVPYLHFYPP
ncbi:hypothetical protein Tco_1467994 [Tanacetum coccineum]